MARYARILTVLALLAGCLYAAAPARAADCEFNFTTTGYYRGEEQTGAKIVVERSTGCGNAAQTVRVTTSPGSATPGVDYQDATQTLNFPASIDNTAGRQKGFIVTLIDDTIREGNKTVDLRLSDPSSGEIGDRFRAILTIYDNESDRVQFVSSEYHVSESAGTVTLGLTRLGVTTQGGTVTWDTGQSIGGTSAPSSASNVTDFTQSSGTVTFAPNQTTATISIPILNDNRGEGDEEFVVTLYTGGIQLGNPTRSYVLIVDDGDPPPPTVQLSASSFSVSESAGAVTITVRRTGSINETTSFGYYTTEDSASSPDDFAAQFGLGTDTTIAAGQTSKTFTIPIVDDAEIEGNEVFLLQLRANSPSVLGTPDSAVVTIMDDDAPMPEEFAFGSANYSASESDGSVTLTVNRLGPNTAARTVSYTTSNGTATAGSDYTSASGSINFAAGESSAIFEVPILSDATNESNETFRVTLSSPSGGATLGTPATATVTISDTNPDSSVAFAAENYYVNEASGTAQITVMRAGDTTTAGVFEFSTSDGTALAGIDYVGSATSVEFAAGETSQTIPVTLIDDEAIEETQTFTVGLTAVSGGLPVAEPDTATVTIFDNDENEAVTHGRAVTLIVRRHIKVRGAVSTDGPDECIAFVPIEVQRRSGGEWRRVASGATGADGSFFGRLADRPGRYRAFASMITTVDGEECGDATSAIVRHRH